MTKENAKDFLPLVQALAEGKTIQLASGNDWYDVNPDFTCPPRKYRIKPEPKLRPWKPEEVPVGCLLRGFWGKAVLTHTIGTGEMTRFCAPDGTDIGRQWYVSQSRDLEMEYSLDHGKTWLPCGVVEGEV